MQWASLVVGRTKLCGNSGVNSVGDDAYHYNGYTIFVTPYGKVMECKENIADTLTCELNLEKLVSFRRKFPVLLDAD